MSARRPCPGPAFSVTGAADLRLGRVHVGDLVPCRGGAPARAHLLAQGRLRIVYVTGPDSLRQCADRGRGLAKAIAAADLCFDDVVHPVRVPALTGAAGRQAVERVLADGWADAVFCANDVLALGVLGGLLHAGISVPDDVALVGYDDIEFAATAAVPLTSVQQPAQQIGRTAATLLLDELENKLDHAHQDVVFRPTLVRRGSSELVLP